MTRQRELAIAQISGPAHAFFAIGDHQNLRAETADHPLTTTDIRSELHFYLLFCKSLSLVAEDLLLNERLTSLLLTDEYRALFNDGVFIPLLRDDYDSIADVVRYLGRPDMYNPVPPEVYSPLLHELTNVDLAVVRFSEQVSYERFTSIARRYLLDDAMLSSFGIGGLGERLSARMDELCKQAGRKYWRRSLLFYFARELDEEGEHRAARVVRHISSVLYTAQFCGALHQLPAFPAWYDKYVTTLTGMSDGGRARPDLREVAVVSLAHLSPHIRPQAGGLSIRQILTIRESTEFAAYLTQLERCNRDFAEGASSETSFIVALETYLRFLDTRFGIYLDGRETRRRRLERKIRLLRHVTPLGIVISLASATAGALSHTAVGLVVSPIWGAMTISFLLYRRHAESKLDELDHEAAKFWSAWCSPGGTFAASLMRSSVVGGLTDGREGRKEAEV